MPMRKAARTSGFFAFRLAVSRGAIQPASDARSQRGFTVNA